MFGIVLSAIIDIGAYKFRHLANAILYIECIIVALLSLNPTFSKHSLDSMSIVVLYLVLMLSYYTDHIGQVIFVTVI